MAGLRLEHIYKVYPNGTKAVSDFTMDIKDQEFIVFVGPSGCGKSTTLRMIAGLEDISAGELYIGDKIVNDVEPKDRDIAMVFQNYALYPHMTVYENMAFGLKLRHVPNAEIHEKVLWAANVLDLTEYLDRKPKAMSGGQRQRVALGRAILRNPKVMLLDEPLSNLDAKLRSQMRSEIAKLHDELKTTFIYVTHDQVEAMTLGTRVVVMKLGRIMQIDTPKNLYDYPNNLFVAGFIGTPQMNFFHAVLTKVKNNIHVDFKWSEDKLDIPQSVLSKVQPKYFDGKTEVVFGIRCEHVSVTPEVVAKSKYLIDVKISHFEELGNETLIYGDINMEGDGFKESNTRIIIKGESAYNLKKGDVVKAAINVSKVQLFDNETENTINPRVPSTNLVDCTIKNNVLALGELKINLPKAIVLADGNYNALIPTNAVTLNTKGSNSTTVLTVETVEDKVIVGLKLGEQNLFTVTNQQYKVDQEVSFDLDFTQIDFMQNGEVVQKSVPEYDMINAMFLNYETAKIFVGNEYDSVVNSRVEAVNAKYLPLLNDLKTKYEADVEAAKNVDSESIKNKNAQAIADSSKTLSESLLKLKTELKKNLNKIKVEHTKRNVEITRSVEETYSRLKKEELDSFEKFKAINRDKDAYRKRSQEIRNFKSNIILEKQNELDKQINLEAVKYESDLNAMQGIYNRTVDALKKNHKTLVKNYHDEAYPIQALTKKYNKEVKEIRKEFTHELNMAKIIFFFKTDNLVTLSSDAISSKMVQSLGIKVFTKEYLVDIPHDAYIMSDKGLELDVIDILDYGNTKFLHCQLVEDRGTTDVYVKTNQNEVTDKKIKVIYDVSKIHITEKSMEIKIY